MASKTADSKRRLSFKDRNRDREDSGPVAGAGIEKHGYGGMDTKNKQGKDDKKGI